MPICCLNLLISAFLSVISFPSTTMLPLVGVSNKLIQRKNVLLPEPEGPIKLTTYGHVNAF